MSSVVCIGESAKWRSEGVAAELRALPADCRAITIVCVADPGSWVAGFGALAGVDLLALDRQALSEAASLACAVARDMSHLTSVRHVAAPTWARGLAVADRAGYDRLIVISPPRRVADRRRLARRQRYVCTN